MAGGRIRGLTIEIEGNTTKLASALKDVDKQAAAAGRSLKDINNLLKLDPGNTDLLAQKHRALAEAIDNTKQRLEMLKEAGKQANDVLAAGDISQGQYDALQREIVETEKKLEGLESEYGELEGASKKATGSLSSDMKDLGESMKQTGEKWKESGRNMIETGHYLTSDVTKPILGIGEAALQASRDWESAFIGVKKTVDATDEEFAILSDNIGDMALSTASSREEIARVMEVAGQLGIAVGESGETITDFTKTMVMMGDATDLSAEEAATAIAQFMNVTGVSQDKASKLGSTMVDLGNKFATNEPKIADMAQRLASAGTLSGLSASEILGLAAAMSSMGINAEAGGTAMSTTMKQISANVAKLKSDDADVAGKAAAAVQKYADLTGMSAEQFAKTWKEKPQQALLLFLKSLGDLEKKGGSMIVTLGEMKMSGIRQSDAIQRLALGYDVLDDAMSVARDAYSKDSALQEEAQKRYESTDSQISQTTEAYKMLMQSIGDELVPLLQEFLPMLVDIMKSFTGLDDGTKKLIIGVAGIAAAVGPVLTALGGLMFGAGELIGVFGGLVAGGGEVAGVMAGAEGAAGGLAGGFAAMSGPIALVVGAIILAVAALVDLWNNSEAFRESVTNIIKDIIEVAKDFFSGLIDRFNDIAGFFTDIEERTGVFSKLWDQFCTSIGAALTASLRILQAVFKAFTENFMGLLDIFIGLFTGDWGRMWQGVQEIVQSAGTLIEGIFTAMVDGICVKFGITREQLVGILENIGEAFSNKWNAIKEWTSETFNNIKETIGSGIDAALETVGRVLLKIHDKFKEIWDKVKETVKAAIEAVKKAMNFKWSLPKLKMPHVKIDGHFSLNPPSAPKFSIDWYKKAMENGMILNSPTIFGAAGNRLLAGGEAGPEAVVGVESLRGMIQEAVAGVVGGSVGPFTIPVYIGSSKVDTVVADAINRANYKSGGR